MGGQYLVAARRSRRELHADGLRGLLRLFKAHHFVEHLLAAFRRDDVAFAVPAALLCDIGLLPRDLLLLILVVLLGDLAVDVARLDALRVAARVEFCAVMLDLQGLVRDAVEEVTVVRNDHDAFFVGNEIVLEPAEGLDIEVVGRLVEEQNVRLARKLSRKGKARALTARKGIERLMHRFAREAHLHQNRLTA